MLFNASCCGFIIKTNISLVQVPRTNNAFIHLLWKQRNSAIWWFVSQLPCNTAIFLQCKSNFAKFLLNCGIFKLAILNKLLFWIKILLCSTLHCARQPLQVLNPQNHLKYIFQWISASVTNKFLKTIWWGFLEIQQSI